MIGETDREGEKRRRMRERGREREREERGSEKKKKREKEKIDVGEFALFNCFISNHINKKKLLNFILFLYSFF